MVEVVHVDLHYVIEIADIERKKVKEQRSLDVVLICKDQTNINVIITTYHVLVVIIYSV